MDVTHDLDQFRAAATRGTSTRAAQGLTCGTVTVEQPGDGDGNGDGGGGQSALLLILVAIAAAVGLAGC